MKTTRNGNRPLAIGNSIRLSVARLLAAGLLLGGMGPRAAGQVLPAGAINAGAGSDHSSAVNLPQTGYPAWSRGGRELALSSTKHAGSPTGPRPALPNEAFPTSHHDLGRQWWYDQRAYPLGYIPSGARVRALQQMRQARQVASKGTRRPLTGGSGVQWVNIGPAPIVNGQTAPPRPVSGRVTCLAVDPNNAAHWLAGAAQGGVWETTDSGTTWTPRTDDQPSLAMGAVAFAPSNPAILFAGTGEPNSSDSYPGEGLLKSTDGGQTWQVLGAAVFANTSFSAIRVHPANPNYVVAATSPDRSVLSAIRGTAPPAPVNGIFLSMDGGATWTQKLTGPVVALEVQPSDFNNQLAGVADVGNGSMVQSAAAALYRSQDGGSTWHLLTGPWGGNPQVVRVALAISASSPNTAYVCWAKDDNNLLGLWRTDNAWDATPTWANLPVPSSTVKTNVGQLNYEPVSARSLRSPATFTCRAPIPAASPSTPSPAPCIKLPWTDFSATPVKVFLRPPRRRARWC